LLIMWGAVSRYAPRVPPASLQVEFGHGTSVCRGSRPLEWRGAGAAPASGGSAVLADCHEIPASAVPRLCCRSRGRKRHSLLYAAGGRLDVRGWCMRSRPAHHCDANLQSNQNDGMCTGDRTSQGWANRRAKSMDPVTPGCARAMGRPCVVCVAVHPRRPAFSGCLGCWFRFFRPVPAMWTTAPSRFR
jgi:hypothetical protein